MGICVDSGTHFFPAKWIIVVIGVSSLICSSNTLNNNSKFRTSPS